MPLRCGNTQGREPQRGAAVTDSTIPPRTCTRCKKPYPATTENFKPQPKGKYGLSSWCYACHDEYQAEYRLKNRERRRAYNKWYDTEHRDQRKAYYLERRDHFLDYYRQYYLDNKPRYQRQQREWTLSHPNYRRERYWGDPQWYREQSKQSRQKFPIRVRANNRNRKSRIRKAEGTYSFADIEALNELQHNLCAYCGIRLFDDFHIDHIEPLLQGGSNWPDNLALSCPSCNISKSDWLLSEWEVKRGW